jgi:hypothetical protein
VLPLPRERVGVRAHRTDLLVPFVNKKENYPNRNRTINHYDQNIILASPARATPGVLINKEKKLFIFKRTADPFGTA